MYYNSGWKQLGIGESGTVLMSTSSADGGCIPNWTSLDGTYAKLKTPNELVHNGNEFTYANKSYGGVTGAYIWHNYRTADGGTTSGKITGYKFGNGRGGVTGVELETGSFLASKYTLNQTGSIILRPGNANYIAGLGYDTNGNECVALWAKNPVTRLRWYAGKDMSTMASGSMMLITPDFEISKSSGKPIGYIGGNEIYHAGNIGNINITTGGTVSGKITLTSGSGQLIAHSHNTYSKAGILIKPSDVSKTETAIYFDNVGASLQVNYADYIVKMANCTFQVDDFANVSDIRKKNIVKDDIPLDKCYDLANKCSKIIYTLKDSNVTREQIGMIAQEVEQYIPELVTTDSEGFKSMSYDRIGIVALKLLSDIDKRLTKLEEKMNNQ